MRRPRFGEPRFLAEVSTRTDNACHRLVPSPELNDMVLGVIGRAQEHYNLNIHGFVFMSNHYHMLVTAADADTLASFICFINTNVAKEINRNDGVRGHVWGRRFSGIPFTGEDAAQVSRLRYILAHGVKERLVQRVHEWPGATSLPWLLDGEPLVGTWRDRTAEYFARRRKRWKETEMADFATQYTLRMAPLPCWADLPPSDWRRFVAAMVDEIEAELLAELEGETPPQILGAAAVMARDPWAVPPRSKRSPCPAVHAASAIERRRWHARWRELQASYANAAAQFRDGDYGVEFPMGTFRPDGGFVPWPPVSGA